MESSFTRNSLAGVSNRSIIILDAILSVAAVVFLFWLIYFQKPQESSRTLDFLPSLNAALNTLSTLLLLLGFFSVRAGRISRHKLSMTGALFSSALFLMGYVIYHSTHGDTKFAGEGAIRVLYFGILVSHVVLSIIMLPFIIYTYLMGLAGKISQHKKTAFFTFAIWLYVSVTGVLVYFFLRVWFVHE